VKRSGSARRYRPTALRSRIFVSAPAGKWLLESKRVTSALRRALRALKGGPYAVEVYLVSASEMKKLNCKYRGKDAPTTVLSFGPLPAFPGPLGNRTGDIYLAPAVIKARKEPIERFAVHALLHLVGYTHAGKHDTMMMEAKEDLLLGND
jgi:rRNA maturation RNase YbeY